MSLARLKAVLPPLVRDLLGDACVNTATAATGLSFGPPAALGFLAAYAGMSYFVSGWKKKELERLIHKLFQETQADVKVLRKQLDGLLAVKDFDAQQDRQAMLARFDEIAELKDALARGDGELNATLAKHEQFQLSFMRYVTENFDKLHEKLNSRHTELVKLIESHGADNLLRAITPRLEQLAEGQASILEKQDRGLANQDAMMQSLAEIAGQVGKSREQLEAELRPIIEAELRSKVRSEFEQQLADKDKEIRVLTDGALRAARLPGLIEELKRTRNPAAITAALDAQRQELFKLQSAVDSEALSLDRELAAWAYLTGEIDLAEAALRRILDTLPDDLDAVTRLGHINYVRGDLSAAETQYRRLLDLAPDDESCCAAAYSNLGAIYQTRGDLDEAERLLREALEIDEKLGRLEGMASDYGGLGVIYGKRGDLDEAERLLRKALEINEKLGGLEGMASDYGNLGLIYQIRGDLDEAERLHRKALEIHEKLGRLEGMASHYGNLGIIYRNRGDLDEAERWHRKSLEIEEKLDRLEGMASDYGNLGLIYEKRGDLDEAERLLRKSLEINEKLGRLEGMANQYGNLGLIYQTRGDLDEAERLLRKALEINEGLGRLEGMARQYGALGVIYKTRGDLDEARRLWTQARDLFAKIGMRPEREKVQSWLDALPPP